MGLSARLERLELLPNPPGIRPTPVQRAADARPDLIRTGSRVGSAAEFPPRDEPENVCGEKADFTPPLPPSNDAENFKIAPVFRRNY